MPECKRCGKQIRWGKSSKGKWMPMEADGITWHGTNCAPAYSKTNTMQTNDFGESAYDQGQKDYASGKQLESCPYSHKGKDQMAMVDWWKKGWRDAEESALTSAEGTKNV